MLLPSGRDVYPSTPIYPGSNFTWGEATKNCSRQLQDLIIGGKLIKSASDIETTIIETAQRLDQYREKLGGRPLWVNSWYRPAHINVRVGGAKYSRHQYGDGVDIRSDYLHSFQIYKLLDRFHLGGLGKYYSFCHIDFRGYKTRW